MKCTVAPDYAASVLDDCIEYYSDDYMFTLQVEEDYVLKTDVTVADAIAMGAADKDDYVLSSACDSMGGVVSMDGDTMGGDSMDGDTVDACHVLMYSTPSTPSPRGPYTRVPPWTTQVFGQGIFSAATPR